MDQFQAILNHDPPDAKIKVLERSPHCFLDRKIFVTHDVMKVGLQETILKVHPLSRGSYSTHARIAHVLKPTKPSAIQPH